MMVIDYLCVGLFLAEGSFMMDAKLPPMDLSAFLADPANLTIFGLVAVFLFAVLLRAHKETALVAVAVAAIGFLVTA
ncbi:MAG: hypothetical protein AB8B85_01340 [Paracoccaceae bacterium]